MNEANYNTAVIVQDYLHEIADDHGVEILFAVESGSIEQVGNPPQVIITMPSNGRELKAGKQ